MSPTTIPGNLILRNTYVVPPLLVYYPGASAAYSLRNLTENNISVVRVCRDNDNAEQDFTAAEVSDGTLTAWVGAGNNGFVRTWYDQSGNGNDATQATAASQPRIIDASSGLITKNGNAALNFDGNDFFTGSSVNISQPLTEIAIAALQAGLENDDNDYRLIWGAVSNAAIYKDDASSPDSFNMFAGTVRFGISANSSQNLWFALFSGSNSFAYINNVSAITGDAGTDSLNSLILGSEAGGVKGWKGTIQEVIIYPTDQSSNRAAIETNINAHYSIYP